MKLTNKRIITHIVSLAGISILIFLTSCNYQPSIEGEWRAWLDSDGGELAFPLHIRNNADGFSAFVVNSSDTTRFTNVEFKDDTLLLQIDYYDAEIEASIDENRMSGEWRRTAEDGHISRLPLNALKGKFNRYPSTEPSKNPFDGTWDVQFTDEDGTFPAMGIFTGNDDGILHGTFRTETGDYRFLEGVFTDSSMILSTFDGSHAFLFDAFLQEDGSIEGNFWSRDTYHATFTAEKGDAELADPTQISAEQAIGNRVEFSFKDTDGHIISSEDEKFQNKPLLVYVFGSWCPNCADEARLLKELYPDYDQTKLEIVGLAFEFTGNFERDAEMVERYRKRFDIPWTLLVAGTSDKGDAAEQLDFLDEVLSYPTSLFTDSNHIINFIHVGFNGPATGPYYYKEVERFKTQLNAITKP